MDEFKPIIDKGNELFELAKFLNIGKPIILAVPMDYHRILYSLSFANTLINKDVKLRYFNIYDSKKDMFEVLKKYHWSFKCNDLQGCKSKDTFVSNITKVDDIINCINNDKPDVAIIDYFDNKLIKSIADLRENFIRLKEASIRNETAIVVIMSVNVVPSQEECEKYDDPLLLFKDTLMENINMVLFVRDANMVTIFGGVD